MRIAVLSVLISFVVMVRAQQQVERYPQMCDELQQVFCDYVSAEAETRYMSSGYGQYVGQLIDNVIYGWGFFIANNNAQTFGQYRKGKHMFGITITDEIARVGSNEHYAEYDLKTGEIVRINTIEGNMRIPEIYVSTPEKKTKYGLNIVCTRSFNHTGVGQLDKFVIPSFCKQVAEINKTNKPGRIYVGNLSAYRDISDVQDVVKVYKMACSTFEIKYSLSSFSRRLL